MNRNTHRNLTSPIIGRCVLLIDNVIKFTTQTPKSIKYPYVDTLKVSAGLLFKYAMYQLKGKDYYKRATELVSEIHAHGIYINNRTVRACKNNLNKPITDLRGLKHLIDSLNSYYGFFRHCKTFNIQNRIANKVREKYGKYIETEMRKGQIVFKLAKPYTRKEASSNSIDLFISNKKLIYYEIRKRSRRCA